MIEDSVRFLTESGREVIYDAEHFFDGYRDNPGYAMQTLEAARRGGARCDTAGSLQNSKRGTERRGKTRQSRLASARRLVRDDTPDAARIVRPLLT